MKVDTDKINKGDWIEISVGRIYIGWREVEDVYVSLKDTRYISCRGFNVNNFIDPSNEKITIFLNDDMFNESHVIDHRPKNGPFKKGDVIYHSNYPEQLCTVTKAEDGKYYQDQDPGYWDANDDLCLSKPVEAFEMTECTEEIKGVDTSSLAVDDFVLFDEGWAEVFGVGNKKIQVAFFDEWSQSFKDMQVKNKSDIITIRKSDSFKVGDRLVYSVDSVYFGVFAGFVTSITPLMIDGRVPNSPNKELFKLDIPVECLHDPFEDLLLDSIISFDYLKGGVSETKEITLMKKTDDHIDGVYIDSADEYRRFSKHKISNIKVIEKPYIVKLHDFLTKVANYVKETGKVKGITTIKNPVTYQEILNECYLIKETDDWLRVHGE